MLRFKQFKDMLRFEQFKNMPKSRVEQPVKDQLMTAVVGSNSVSVVTLE